MPEIDEELYNYIGEEIKREYKTELGKAMFLSNLAYLAEKGELCAKNRNTVLTFLREYYVPLDSRGNLNKGLFDQRMRGIASFKENVCEGIAVQVNTAPGNFPLFLENIENNIRDNERSGYYLKMDSLNRALSRALEGQESETKEWKALKNSDYRTLPGSLRYGLDKHEEIDLFIKEIDARNKAKDKVESYEENKYQAYKAHIAGVDLTPDIMVSLVINSFFYDSWDRKKGEDKNLIMKGWNNNPGSAGFRKAHPELSEGLKKAEVQMLREARKNSWSWMKEDTEIRSRLTEEDGNTFFSDYISTEYASGYFMSEVKDDQKKARLSFGRKGSWEFQNLDTSVEKLKKALDNAKKKGFLTNEDWGNITNLCDDISRQSEAYVKAKREYKVKEKGKGTITKIHEDKDFSKVTLARIRYAEKAAVEAEKLTDAFQNLSDRAFNKHENEGKVTGESDKKLKKELEELDASIEEGHREYLKTKTEKLEDDRKNEIEMLIGRLPKGLSGNGAPVIREAEGRNGTYDSFTVSKDFLEAVLKSNLKDRVSFEQMGENKYRMSPKLPEQGLNDRNERFSVRKNYNYFIKGIARKCFENPENPKVGEINLKEGLERLDEIYIKLGEYQKNREEIPAVLNIPEEDRADFLRFMDDAIDNKYISMGRVLSGIYRKAEKADSVGKDSDEYRGLASGLAELASMDPVAEKKIYLPDENEAGMNLIDKLNRMENNEGLNGKNRISLSGDFDRQLVKAEEKLENISKELNIIQFEKKQDRGYFEFTGDDPYRLTGAEIVMTVNQLTDSDYTWICESEENFDLEGIKRYVRESPFIEHNTELKSRLEEKIAGVENTLPDQKKKENELWTTFQAAMKDQKIYLARNRWCLSAKLNDEMQLRGSNDSKQESDRKEILLAHAGTVSYQGREYMITFEAKGRTASGCGLEKPGIGLFSDWKEMNYTYLLKEDDSGKSREDEKDASQNRQNSSKESVEKVNFQNLVGGEKKAVEFRKKRDENGNIKKDEQQHVRHS